MDYSHEVCVLNWYTLTCSRFPAVNRMDLIVVTFTTPHSLQLKQNKQNNQQINTLRCVWHSHSTETLLSWRHSSSGQYTASRSAHTSICISWWPQNHNEEVGSGWEVTAIGLQLLIVSVVTLLTLLEMHSYWFTNRCFICRSCFILLLRLLLIVGSLNMFMSYQYQCTASQSKT